jgi:hypothetical protein
VSALRSVCGEPAVQNSPDMAMNRDKRSTATLLKTVLALVVAVGSVIAAPTSASAQPDGALTVEVVKYPTPVFGVRLAQLVKGTPPNGMDITGPPENGRDMDGGQVSQIYQIRPGSQPATASAFYDVDQNGRHLGTFRVDFKLGEGGDPNSLEVSCNEQDSPVDCWAFGNPFIVRVYAKTVPDVN